MPTKSPLRYKILWFNREKFLRSAAPPQQGGVWWQKKHMSNQKQAADFIRENRELLNVSKIAKKVGMTQQNFNNTVSKSPTRSIPIKYLPALEAIFETLRNAPKL